MRPTVGSVFSGIGGFDLGLERAGWQVRWQIENNSFRQNILRRHWPDMELRTDVRTDTDGLERTDLVCGGFPCTDLSVAGKRAGLAGEQSTLWYDFRRLVEDTRPTWVLVENVPGLLSSHEGEDFAIVVRGLAELGFGVAWRVLDSRYFGVAQRRRRVFIAGRAGRPCPLEVLFEPESGGRDTEALQTTDAEVAKPLVVGAGGGGQFQHSSTFIPERSLPLHGRGGRNNDLSKESYIVYGPTNRADGRDWHELQRARAVNPSSGLPGGGTSGIVVSAEADAHGVREATGVPGRLDAPDGPRYAALGDAVTVPVIEWIGRRMLAVHRRMK